MRGRQRLAALSGRLLLARPQTGRLAQRLDAAAARLAGAWQRSAQGKSAELSRLAASLTQLNPDAVLARGYSMVTDDAGRIVRDSSTLEPNDRIAVFFQTGRANATVTSTSK